MGKNVCIDSSCCKSLAKYINVQGSLRLNLEKIHQSFKILWKFEFFEKVDVFAVTGAIFNQLNPIYFILNGLKIRALDIKFAVNQAFSVQVFEFCRKMQFYVHDSWG